MSFALDRPRLQRRVPMAQSLDLETFARAAGVHPGLVRRLVALGLIEAVTDAAGELWFAPAQLAAAARLQRLRAGFALNYAALGLVTHLLDRIAELEAALWQHRPPQHSRPETQGSGKAPSETGGRSWT